MSELLLRVVNKQGSDLYKTCQLTQCGDVIVVVPDGWLWSTEEQTNPAWRIIKAPNLPLDEAQALLAEELPQDPQDLRKTLLRRFFRLNIDATLPNRIRNWLNDNTRRDPFLTIDVAQIRAIRVQKARVADPEFTR